MERSDIAAIMLKALIRLRDCPDVQMESTEPETDAARLEANEAISLATGQGVAQLPKTEKPQIIVGVQRGAVQWTISDLPAYVMIVDYDTQGCDPADLPIIPGQDATDADLPAFIRDEIAEIMPERVRQIIDATS